MAFDEGLAVSVEEAMAPLGIVTRRAMMGGATLYCEGTIFAILASDGLWFKADAVSDGAWDQAGCARFTYEKGEGRTGSMNYCRAPDDCYDDADTLREWAALALAAGARGPAKRQRR